MRNFPVFSERFMTSWRAMLPLGIGKSTIRGLSTPSEEVENFRRRLSWSYAICWRLMHRGGIRKKTTRELSLS